MVDAGPEPTYEEKMRVPPLGFRQGSCPGFMRGSRIFGQRGGGGVKARRPQSA